LAGLPVVETGTSGYVVHPFLARLGSHPTWVLQETEIVGVLTPAVEQLGEPTARETLPFTSRRFPDPLEVDGIDVDGHVLWGLTLRILDGLLPRLLAGEWEI
jgi:hypothetical protein